MSSKVTFTEVALSNFLLWFFVNPASGPPAPSIPWARLDIQIQTPMMSAQGSSVITTCTANGCS